MSTALLPEDSADYTAWILKRNIAGLYRTFSSVEPARFLFALFFPLEKWVHLVKHFNFESFFGHRCNCWRPQAESESLRRWDLSAGRTVETGDMRLFVICALLLLKVRNSWSQLCSAVKHAHTHTHMHKVTRRAFLLFHLVIKTLW